MRLLTLNVAKTQLRNQIMQNNSAIRALSSVTLAAGVLLLLAACRQPAQGAAAAADDATNATPAAKPAQGAHASQESGGGAAGAAQSSPGGQASPAVRPTDEAVRNFRLVGYWCEEPEIVRAVCEKPSVINAIFLMLPHPMEDVVQEARFRRIQARRLEAFRLAVEIAPPDMILIPVHRPIAAYGYKGRFTGDQFYDPDFWKELVERAERTERELLERGRRTWRGLDVEFYGDGEEFKNRLDRARLIQAMSDCRNSFDVGVPSAPFGGPPEYGWMTRTLCKREIAPTYYRVRMARTPRDQIAQLVVNKTGEGPDNLATYTPEQAVQVARERGNVMIYCGDKDGVGVARMIVEASQR